MKWLALLMVFLPCVAMAAISGVDDVDPNIPTATQENLDKTVLGYYLHPSVDKVNTVLDIMNDSDVLRRKTAWPFFVGFLSVVFADNKDHTMSWIARNDYNTYAEDVFMAALMHAKLKESALVFAQAHQWKPDEIEHVRQAEDTTDLKKLPVVLPGHIDSLWGAFFASGDKVYVNEIIDVLFMQTLPRSKIVEVPIGHSMKDVLKENRQLAVKSLRSYALDDKMVRDVILERLKHEKNAKKKKILGSLLPKMSFPAH